jgi:hypothetical protein
MICLSEKNLIDNLEDISSDLLAGHTVVAAHRLGILIGLLYNQHPDDESDESN